MSKNKSVYCSIAGTLIILVFSSMICPVIGQVIKKEGEYTWNPPENFADPVTLKIQEFRAQGLSDDEIIVELEKLNMGWYPETGATWIGKVVPSEEANKLSNRISPNDSSTNSSIQQDTALTMADRVANMKTSQSSWRGVSAEMICGSMSVSSGQTMRSYLCLQMGDLTGASSWGEVVVTHNYGETYKWYTFDPDEGNWIYCGDKDTASTATDTYVMLLDGTSDAGGYNYDIWINYQWVKHAHLPSLNVQACLQKEVYSDSGQFTNDASHAVFYRNWLSNGQGWSYWTSNALWSSSSPVRESHTMGALSYYWETWLQN
jgi:hypothetical protein